MDTSFIFIRLIICKYRNISAIRAQMQPIIVLKREQKKRGSKDSEEKNEVQSTKMNSDK